MCYIAGNDFINGSFRRRKFEGYARIKQYKYREITADMTTENCFVKDGFLDMLKSRGLIEQNSFDEYLEELIWFFNQLPDMVDKTDEEIYSDAINYRKTFLDKVCRQYIDAIKADYYKRETDHLAITGIDQSNILSSRYDKAKNIYFIIDDYTYIGAMIELYKKIGEYSDSVYIIVKEEGSVHSMVTKTDLECYLKIAEEDISIDRLKLIVDDYHYYGFDLRHIQLSSSDDILIGFGEWCLSSFKKLNVEAFVYCRSNELITRALTNSISEEEIHFIYIPKGYDMLKHIRLVEKTAFNYRMLSWIYNEIGMEAYKRELIALLREFPDVFLNSNSDKMLDLKCEWSDIDGTNFHDIPQQLIKKHIKKKYKYLDIDDYVYKDRCGNDIRVNYIKLDNSKNLNMSVKTWNNPVNPRSYFRNNEFGDCLVSNFLFFVTPKTIELYNHIRALREREKINRDGWHIDYKFESNSYGRCETFPLYNKAAIGKLKNGRVEFFRKTLKSGNVIINGVGIQWEDYDININSEGDVILYTPLDIENDSGEYNHYNKKVGKNRINIICVDDSIICIRKGDVILPSMGVVISLSLEKWDGLFPNMKYDQDGYFDIGELHFDLYLHGSDEYEWCYGGGMFLIYEGIAFDTDKKLKDELMCEGWLTKLSMQTQESEIHKIEKHPRTAVGLTKDQKFFILVCSGRNMRSAGADYFDLIDISKKLFGDVLYLMNLDGGASSFLAYTTQKELLELNDIAYSNISCAGVVRPVNSIMVIDLNGGEKHENGN